MKRDKHQDEIERLNSLMSQEDDPPQDDEPLPTLAHLAANRFNAQKSTGPRTAAGKSSSSKNALKHGLLSSQVLLPAESAEVFGEFAAGMRDALSPVGTLEDLLVERIVTGAWRLRRVVAVETATLRDGQAEPTASILGGRLPNGPLAVAYGSAAPRLDSLTRYETTIERGVLRALHELERVQARREGRVTSVPAVVDVDVSSGR